MQTLKRRCEGFADGVTEAFFGAPAEFVSAIKDAVGSSGGEADTQEPPENEEFPEDEWEEEWRDDVEKPRPGRTTNNAPSASPGALRRRLFAAPSSERLKKIASTAPSPSVSDPVLCIVKGNSLMWKVQNGNRPVYPVFLRDSAFNSDVSFDAGTFT